MGRGPSPNLSEEMDSLAVEEKTEHKLWHDYEGREVSSKEKKGLVSLRE